MSRQTIDRHTWLCLCALVTVSCSLARAQNDQDVYRGQWHGDKYYFGLHYDLHANENDTELGTQATPENLVPMFKQVGADFVQTDCKGHPGYTSWFSQTPTASIPPQLKADALQGWRAATRQLGLPLHCHYSGIWDAAAAKKYPEWAVLNKDGRRTEHMCPRGPYLDELMIPQMIELIDRYEVDGFWIDGDIWAVEPCYCPRCAGAFADQTGIAEPPRDKSDPNWIRFMQFTRAGFQQYATRYCDAVHKHKPGVLVCSNWMQTFHDPGPPIVPTDWISGDNAHTFGLDGGRLEARFVSTRGKPWDVMIWSFYGEVPRTVKAPQMIQQEAAVVLSLGGRVQVYEHPHNVRDGRLVEWRCRLIGETAQFIEARKALCENSETIPQVAVLHSEHHLFNTPFHDLYWSLDTNPVAGATWAMLENHYSVDLMDEWALLPRLHEFALVVAPERHAMSQEMVEALKKYVENGGNLLVSGAASFDRFGGDFLGIKPGQVSTQGTYWAPVDGDKTVVMISGSWRLTETTTARELGKLGYSTMPDDMLTPHPAATINKFGKGQVAYIPFDVFRHFHDKRFPRVRAFVGEVTRELVGQLPIEVQGPTAVDVTLRKKDNTILVHLVNRTSGIPNRPNDATIDEIPVVGPITLTMKMDRRPQSVELAFEDRQLKWDYADERLTARLDGLHIHAAIVIEP